MSAKLCIANWKMNGRRSDWRGWALSAGQNLNQLDNVEVVLCPPAPGLVEVAEQVAQAHHIFIGAQDVCSAEDGSYTGDVNAPMLLDVGCSYVLVGHSERRKNYKESNHSIALKIDHALHHGLVPVLCIGETAAEREAGEMINVLDTQLVEGLRGIEVENALGLVVAYEPVWAIGSGKVATPADLAEPLRYIRAALADRFGEAGQTMRILYGGSVTAHNAKTLKELPIDGVLVGSSSLKPEEWRGIVAAFG